MGCRYKLDDIVAIFHVVVGLYPAEVPFVFMLMPKGELNQGERWAKLEQLRSLRLPVHDLRSYIANLKSDEHHYINWEIAMWMGRKRTNLLVAKKEVELAFF
jgi:hypothetical protein